MITFLIDQTKLYLRKNIINNGKLYIAIKNTFPLSAKWINEWMNEKQQKAKILHTDLTEILKTDGELHM